MTEFNLSEKIEQSHFNEPIDMLKAEDVKEFIRLLKASPDFDEEDKNFIDKLAGDKLKW
jgi:hypothetical protein